jgi:type II secretory pathway pseudopilin PulG
VNLSSHKHGTRAGFTLIELVLAAGLMTLLMVAVFGLIEGSLSLWSKSETRRNLSEQATGVAELLASDLRGLESGERGDLLVEWETFDTDGDGLKEMAWPRLRMVRQASEAELARLEAKPTAAVPQGEEAQPAPERRLGSAQIEVCWAVLPFDLKDRDARSEGLISRGARRLDDEGSRSFFEGDFFSASGKPDKGVLDEVTAGLLWFQPLLATQTSIVHDGWFLGSELADAATSWDAWALGRPDTTRHAWNAPGAGMPRVGDHPLLPRRIRIELEFERAVDRKRRTRTLDVVELTDAAFQLDDERLMPEAGTHIKLDGEWMLVKTVRSNQLTVERAVRGTRAMIHEAGTMVHWGLPLVREVPVDLYREDWNL